MARTLPARRDIEAIHAAAARRRPLLSIPARANAHADEREHAHPRCARNQGGAAMAKKWDDVKHKQADVANELKTFADTPARKAAVTKLASIKKWPADSGSEAAMKKLYDDAAKVAAAPQAQAIDVALKSYTRPKFAHNASNAGTLPVWTFQFVDTATRKTGEVAITMTKSMTKDEPTAKKQMSDAAVAEVKKRYPKATVKINNGSLDK
jgi:hypothetical protein